MSPPLSLLLTKKTTRPMSRKNKWLSHSNPVLSEEAFRDVRPAPATEGPIAEAAQARMTVAGAVNKSLLLGLLMMATAAWSYLHPSPVFLWLGALGGLGVVLVAVFKRTWSPWLAPLYAGLEGLFLGTISALYGSMYHGIVFQAITLTMAVFFAMLFLYKARIIVVTERLRAGVVMATAAIAIVYVLHFVLSLFGIQMPLLHESGFVGIGISLVIIGVAAMNLLLDFDFFEKGEQYGAPAYMEWFAAMGLLITLVWLYVEILRLLAMLNRN